MEIEGHIKDRAISNMPDAVVVPGECWNRRYYCVIGN